MTKSPWTDHDRNPATSTPTLTGIDRRYLEVHAGDPDAKLTIVVGIEDEDAERHQRPRDVISSLLRSA